MAEAEKTQLILIPGMLCTDILWGHQCDTLIDIADIMVAEVVQHDSIEAMAKHVLANAPPRFALAGLSMGGYVAQEIMRRAPQRVSALALIDTAARADTEEQHARRAELIGQVKRIAPTAFSGVTRRLLPLLIHPDRQSEDILVNAIKKMAQSVGRDAYVLQQTAIMNRPDGVEDLSAITCPTLIACGREDAITPLKVHEEMADAIPGAKLVAIEECGHLAPLERPYAVSALLRYWLNDAI